MHSLPRAAKIYLVGVYLAGILTFASAGLVGLSRLHASAWEPGLFLLLALLAGGKKVCLMRHKSMEDVGSISLGFAITFAAIVRFGPVMGMLVGAVSMISAGLYPKVQPLHQLAFNVALNAFQAWVAGWVFVYASMGMGNVGPIAVTGGAIAATLIYFAINTGGVAIIIGLCTHQCPLSLWKTNFLWMAPTYFAAAGISTLAMFLFGQHSGFMLVLIAPVIFLTYHSYAVYAARAEEKQQHIEELQLSQAQLADLYLATIKSLALAIDAKDQYTHQHI
ncbi:MAG TPA: hypothetical protein VFA07_08170, partial [Chthonomonadaceae bacterium]|nr:hypothetical protein [Chthonomonadaceae bacterium]